PVSSHEREYQQQVEAGHITKPPFDRVVFLRIEPFPPSAATITENNGGLKTSLFGPLTALASTRTSTQAERADLELSLLMDVTKSELSQSQDTMARQLTLIKETVKEAESQLDGPDYFDLVDEFHTLTEMDFDLKSKEKLEKVNRQIKTIGSEVDRRDPSTNTVLKKISDVIHSYQEAQNRGNVSNVPKIEIKSALFRFDTRKRLPPVPKDAALNDSDSENTVQEKASDEPSHNPPLSWRLAKEDMHAIEVAWQNYSRAFSNEFAAASGEDGKTELWESLDETQAENTLHPNQLLNLLGD
ncbi:MAG: hypothetical protein AAF497_23410, partial [Planctomycetota bacterium]